MLYIVFKKFYRAKIFKMEQLLLVFMDKLIEVLLSREF